MRDENRNTASQMLETGASAAHTIHGAVRVGNAISGAAKGAAAGPFGTVAGTLWGSRQNIGKIVLAAVALLMLPVLFVVMVPSLIFGGLDNAFSPADPDNPIVNSEAAIIDNANAITITINEILGEGLDDVLKRIDTDFARSDGEQKEITNPYAKYLLSNLNLFVAQYCAAKNADFQSVSLDDMAAILRREKAHLYSFKRTEELRDKVEIDPNTGLEITVPEKWMLYKVVYNGESYFADTIFHLSEEQKELAKDYADNLVLFLGDGLLQNLTGFDNPDSIPPLGNVQFTDGGTPVVYYNQRDARYASQPYGTDDIGTCGCGPTSMAMVVSSLTSETVDPVAMAAWSYENGYWIKNGGSYHALIPAAAENWKLPVAGCTTSEPQRLLDALSSGKLVVAIMGPGHFTTSGHFIVLRGVQDGKILVADPYSYKQSEKLWDLSIILNEASRRAAAGGPFWIIG